MYATELDDGVLSIMPTWLVGKSPSGCLLIQFHHKTQPLSDEKTRRYIIEW